MATSSSRIPDSDLDQAFQGSVRAWRGGTGPGHLPRTRWTRPGEWNERRLRVGHLENLQHHDLDRSWFGRILDRNCNLAVSPLAIARRDALSAADQFPGVSVGLNATRCGCGTAVEFLLDLHALALERAFSAAGSRFLHARICHGSAAAGECAAGPRLGTGQSTAICVAGGKSR